MSPLDRRLITAIRALEAVNEAIGRALAWLTLGMVLTTFAVVVLRYAFDLGWIAMQESVTYMHALLFMGAAAYTLRHQGHVRVDIFYRRFSPKGRARVDLFGVLFLLWPVCGFILWSGWGYVADSWAVHEASREAGGLPGVWLLKTLILAMPALFMVQGTAQALRALLVLRGTWDDEMEMP